jgi:cadmium resistance protein CadD (predicted permease)
MSTAIAPPAIGRGTDGSVLESLVAIAGLVVAAFASTNVDNLLLLVSWMVAGGLSRRSLFGGYLLGMLAVLALAVVVGLAGYLFPLEYLGYLGIIPIFVGVKSLLARQPEVVESSALSGSTYAVAATQLSNGVDTVLIFAPLLADSLLEFDAVIALLFLLMIPLWFGLAQLLCRHVERIPGVARVGRWLAPAVMIMVGFYILSNTATDLAPPL